MTDDTFHASRRGVLRQAAASAVGAVALAVGLDRAALAAPAPPAPPGTGGDPAASPGASLALHGRGWYLTGTGHRQGMAPQEGQRGAVSGELLDPATGRAAGTFRSACFHGGRDAAASQLMLACASGQHIKSAKLFVRKQGGGQEDYLAYTFADLLVSSFAESGAGGEAPSEEIAFRYRRIVMEYRADSGRVVKGAWDLGTNKRV